MAILEGPATVPAAFRATAERAPERVAIRTADGTELTYADLRRRVDALAGGLASLGVKRGDVIALLMGNRPGFLLCDLAGQTLGATVFSIYLTSSPEQVEHLLSDAGATVAIVDAATADAFFAARDRVDGLEHVITLDPGPDGTISLAELEELDRGFDPAARLAALDPEDVATLIYTSGTTGHPKGVELTHGNLLAAVESWRVHLELPDAFGVISWLPNAHVAERMAHFYVPMVLGGTVTCCEDPRRIVEVLPTVRPTCFFAVPRTWEKLQSAIQAQLDTLPTAQRDQALAALSAAIDGVRLQQRGEPVPEAMAQAVARADEVLFRPIRERIGLDRAVTAVSGGAPTPLGVLEFFNAIGIPLAEGWAMSETCGSGTLNPVGAVKLGTVGIPMPGTELRLAADGEIEMRGPTITRGYRNLPEATREAIDADGWLRTGDIGSLDDDGYLTIVDRKKELIINSAGKNMSPANIESKIKSSSPLIGQCAVIGDARPYVVALLVLDPDYAPVWAADHGLEDHDLASLAVDHQVLAHLQVAVEAANAMLSRVEQVKRFHVVAGDWLPDGDELTPTMKLKRKAIAAKYADAIDGLYLTRV